MLFRQPCPQRPQSAFRVASDKSTASCALARPSWGLCSVPYNTAAAVAAFRTRKAVRICLDRDEDMQTSGHRHAFVAKYKVCLCCQAQGLPTAQPELKPWAACSQGAVVPGLTGLACKA